MRTHMSFFYFSPWQTLFHVINRTTGKALSTRFYGDALVVFHHINAYEEDGHLVFDMICYRDSSLYDMFYIQNFRQEISNFVETNKDTFAPPICKRFVLPLTVKKVSFFVQLHQRHYKYGYEFHKPKRNQKSKARSPEPHVKLRLPLEVKKND